MKSILITGADIPIKQGKRKGQDYWYALDTSRLKALGWKPEHVIRETLEDLWEGRKW